mmetsp:Transcript_15697/g.39099  ORF Transcript_15697/g.39099 Transcript_15697/m.39099 type:complete len:120 (-) Transcript_15697:399-758(-)
MHKWKVKSTPEYSSGQRVQEKKGTKKATEKERRKDPNPSIRRNGFPLSISMVVPRDKKTTTPLQGLVGPVLVLVFISESSETRQSKFLELKIYDHIYRSKLCKYNFLDCALKFLCNFQF